MDSAPLYSIRPSIRTVKEVPEERQPREQFDRLGAAQVADEVLLAIILNQGTHGHNVFDMACGLLDHFGSLSKLATASVDELVRVKGIGPIKARIVLSCVELSLRMMREQEPVRPKIDHPDAVARLLKSEARTLNTEVFWVLMLDSKNALLKSPVEVTRGILDASLVHPREVFSEAIKSAAAAVVLVHNHPSGDPQPSNEDIRVTRELVQAGKVLGIPVMDHVVVGRECRGGEEASWFYSIRESGLVLFEEVL